MRILILEDNAERNKVFLRKLVGNESVVITENTKEAIKYLSEDDWDYLFLDHDLAGEEKVSSGEGTGYEVAEWLSNNPDRMPKVGVILHSMNIVGRRNMKRVLPNAIEKPFNILIKEI